jgi:cis-L-3-hydroxyproline dehydratase
LHLTNDEESILKGEEGEGSQRAMELLVAIGDAFDARGFIPISRAHAASSGQEGDLFFVEILAKGNARCKVLTTTNPVVDFDYFQNLININEEHEEASVAWKVKYYYKQIGAVMSQSCIPYLAENIPEYGEHVAFSESSATPYVNSVIGAYSNRESIQSALAAGVIGKTPEYGLHFAENRKGTALVKVECDLKDGFAYSLLGQYVGKQIGNGIPVFSGIKSLPSIDQFINLCAMMNVTGAIGMFHIPGITVGAKTVEEAFDGNKPKEVITVTNHELKEMEESLQTGENEIDTVILGCPHYNLDQIRRVAELLRGKKLKESISFWVNTSATTKMLAERAGMVKDIENAGGRVIVDTCIDMFCWNNLRGKTGMTDSPKCAYYRRFSDVRVGSVEECVVAATN